MRRRSEPDPPYRQPTACERCGYTFDRGRTGARACPRCTEQDLANLDAYCLAMAPALHDQIAHERALDGLIARVAAWCWSRPTGTVH